MATLSPQSATTAGITPTFNAVAAGGDVFANNGKTLIEIVNSSGANSYTVTATTPRTVDGEPVADRAISVGTSARVVAGPFPVLTFNNSSGQVALSYTGSAPATDLTVAIYRID